ncbi:hypothetical protein ZWY2020_054662 [Hordeum vulgare]|nr:hypothetical protein ZWY2020_054662 [Hordeum vulgare]
MITWPHFGEQFLNEKLVVDVLRIGVEVGVKGVTWWGNEKQEIVVTRDEVEKAVSTLMDEGLLQKRQVRAKIALIKARKAFDEGGSSHDKHKATNSRNGSRTNAWVDTDGSKFSFLV